MIQELTVKTVRWMFTAWIWIRNWLRVFFPLPLETQYESKWSMYGEDGSVRTVVAPEFDETHTIAVERVERYRPDGRVDHRCAIWYRDRDRVPYQAADLFHPAPPPWLYIQCGDDDFTDQLSSYVVPGNLILPSFLELFGTGKWTMLDPATFNEREFPSEGLTIQHHHHA